MHKRLVLIAQCKVLILKVNKTRRAHAYSEYPLRKFSPSQQH
ncbi:Hypothetical protein Cp262_1306 [Corynebacterium pseudotuberculosis]|nr:hypothetical protein CPTB_01874 [Corynebacterium pseudotuberculosis]AIG12171.1 hypothetical protein CPTC_01883 [Corynebacterium pseudotuberculosis]AKP08969.1 Hypothetical protein Cp262_1306 [Corynebacterium pseudotuberculosis]AQL51427.1 hypothetical protein CpPA04_1331 [Corynebacterium pseudotuberculosis]ATQ65649.1 Hypothetical protein CpPA07_1348 [Corynebacterium pseudotuberculosis]